MTSDAERRRGDSLASEGVGTGRPLISGVALAVGGLLVGLAALTSSAAVELRAFWADSRSRLLVG